MPEINDHTEQKPFAAPCAQLDLRTPLEWVTACITRINATLRNKSAMAVWCGLIAGLTAMAFLTLGVGLAVVIPVLGYATYHGYQQTIDASGWPESPTTPAE